MGFVPRTTPRERNSAEINETQTCGGIQNANSTLTIIALQKTSRIRQSRHFDTVPTESARQALPEVGEGNPCWRRHQAGLRTHGTLRTLHSVFTAETFVLLANFNDTRRLRGYANAGRRSVCPRRRGEVHDPDDDYRRNPPDVLVTSNQEATSPVRIVVKRFCLSCKTSAIGSALQANDQIRAIWTHRSSSRNDDRYRDMGRSATGSNRQPTHPSKTTLATVFTYLSFSNPRTIRQFLHAPWQTQ